MPTHTSCETMSGHQTKPTKNLGRICHLTSVHAPTDTRIFVKECRTLADAGFETHLVAPRATTGISNKIFLHGLPDAARNRFERMSRLVWTVYQQALALDAQVYHFHDPELIPVGLLLRRHNKLVIYDIHEDVPRQILQKSYLPRQSRRLVSVVIEQLENLAGRHFSALITATPTIGARFAPINPRTVVVNNYPLCNELLPSEPMPWNERNAQVAYVGNITTVRGMFEMVKAMALVSPQLGASLNLAGAIWPVSQRAALIQTPGWSHIRELGVLGRTEVARLLGSVRAGLVVIHPGPNHINSQPNKLFEYMSASIPVIGSDFPLWRDIIDRVGCGLLVNPLDPKAIARAIEFMLTQPEAAETMGQRGRLAVEQQYNWEHEAPKLLNLYYALTA